MKKAMMILILTAILTGCGNSAKEDEKTVTTAVSHETTTAVTSASVSGITDLTTTEISAEITDATAGKISTSRTIKKTETTTSKATTKAKVTTTKKSTSTTTRQTQTAPVQTYIVYYDEPTPETQQTEVKVTETNTTTVQTSPPNTTTTPKQTSAAPSRIEWSNSMKVWKKLSEGQKLTGSEQDIIRDEILDYALQTFNGKKDIHVSFGIDAYDISYEKPLDLTINREMTSMANAHMDAYVDANCKGLIDYASSEQEIYDIVADTRQSCLHVIDYGLYNRWEILSINGSLKYASDIKFNVGFDEDMALWFLTQD